MWNGTMFVDLDWPLNASSLLSASAELLVDFTSSVYYAITNLQNKHMLQKVERGGNVHLMTSLLVFLAWLAIINS